MIPAIFPVVAENNAEDRIRIKKTSNSSCFFISYTRGFVTSKKSIFIIILITYIRKAATCWQERLDFSKCEKAPLSSYQYIKTPTNCARII